MPTSPRPIDSATPSGRIYLTPRTPDRPGRFEGQPAIALALYVVLDDGGGDDSVTLEGGRSVDFLRSLKPSDVSPYALDIASDDTDAPGDYAPLHLDLFKLEGLPIAIEQTELGFVCLHYGAAALRAIANARELEDAELTAGEEA